MPRAGRRKRHIDVVARLAGEIHEDDDIVGHHTAGAAEVDDKVEILVETAGGGGEVGILQGGQRFPQAHQVTVGTEDAVLRGGVAPVEGLLIDKGAGGVELLPHPEHGRSRGGESEHGVKQGLLARRPARRILRVHTVGQPRVVVEDTRLVMVVGEDHAVAGRLGPTIHLVEDLPHVRRSRGDLRGDDVVETRLPVAVEAVGLRGDAERVIKCSRPVVTVRNDREQIGVLGNAPAVRVLLVDHAVDRRHERLALEKDVVRVGAVAVPAEPENVLRRVPAETVDAELVEEHLDIVLDVTPHFRLGVIGAVTPRGPATPGIGREINIGRAVELPETVARRVPVVVHHVDLHFHPAGVGRFDETFQSVRPAVSGLDGEDVLRIVAPTVVAAEFVDRHEGDDIDTETLEVVEAGDGVVKGARAAVVRIGIVEGPDVHFIHDLLVDRDGRAGDRPPVECRVVVDHRVAAAHPQRARILLPRAAAVAGPAEKVLVFLIWPSVSHRCGPITGGIVLGHDRLAPVVELSAHRDTRGIGRPDPEGHPGDGRSRTVDGGAERQRLTERRRDKQQTAQHQQDGGLPGHSGKFNRTRGGGQIPAPPHQKLWGTSIWSPGSNRMSRDGLERTALISTIWTRPPRMTRTLRWSA